MTGGVLFAPGAIKIPLLITTFRARVQFGHHRHLNMLIWGVVTFKISNYFWAAKWQLIGSILRNACCVALYAHAGVHYDRKYVIAMLDLPHVEPLLVSASCSTPENEAPQGYASSRTTARRSPAQRPHARAAAVCEAQVCAGIAALT